MATSGIKANQELVDKYQQLKLKKKYSYLLIKIQNNQFVVIDEGCEQKSFEDFVKAITKQTDCCYGILDGKKVALIAWNPDSATSKSKMLLASSTEGTVYFKKKKIYVGLSSSLEGVHGCINVTDETDLREKLNQRGLV